MFIDCSVGFRKSHLVRALTRLKTKPALQIPSCQTAENAKSKEASAGTSLRVLTFTRCHDILTSNIPLITGQCQIPSTNQVSVKGFNLSRLSLPLCNAPRPLKVQEINKTAVLRQRGLLGDLSTFVMQPSSKKLKSASDLQLKQNFELMFCSKTEVGALPNATVSDAQNSIRGVIRTQRTKSEQQSQNLAAKRRDISN